MSERDDTQPDGYLEIVGRTDNFGALQEPPIADLSFQGRKVDLTKMVAEALADAEIELWCIAWTEDGGTEFAYAPSEAAANQFCLDSGISDPWIAPERAVLADILAKLLNESRSTAFRVTKLEHPRYG